MKLPGAEGAIIPERKVRGYLLSFSHLEGRSKARYFASCGFSDEKWSELASALKLHAIENDASLSKQNDYGMFYNVDGPLMTPTGRDFAIRSVWLLDRLVDPKTDNGPSSISMIAELDVVILTEPLTEHALEKGDVGTVVHIFGQNEAYEVEFVTLKGATAALVTVKGSQLRPVGQKDLLHVRDWNSESSKLAA